MLNDTSSWESKYPGESGTADFCPAVLPGGAVVLSAQHYQKGPVVLHRTRTLSCEAPEGCGSAAG